MSSRERSALDKRINEFLTDRRMGDGGWAPVTERDLNQLCAIIDWLIKMKWETDPDGDFPINWKVIDRTRFEPMHYHPVPYEHKARDDAALADRLSTVLTNADIATHALSMSLRVLQDKLREKPKTQHEG